MSSSQLLLLPSSSPPSPQPTQAPLNAKNIAVTARALHSASRAVFVTGAGISVDAGIPDFRSPDGLYALVQNRFPDTVLRGAELFDSGLFASEERTQMYYSFMAALRTASAAARPTLSHRLIFHMHRSGRLQRVYSQNIDDLERPALDAPQLVRLHGTLSELMCTRCRNRTPFTSAVAATMAVTCAAPDCGACLATAVSRAALNMRARGMGELRPAIVLYNEAHPDAETIAEDIAETEQASPDLLVVVGTSLRVPGARALVRSMAAGVRARGGHAILINATPLPEREWADVFSIIHHARADDVVRACLAPLLALCKRSIGPVACLDRSFVALESRRQRLPANININANANNISFGTSINNSNNSNNNNITGTSTGVTSPAFPQRRKVKRGQRSKAPCTGNLAAASTATNLHRVGVSALIDVGQNDPGACGVFLHQSKLQFTVSKNITTSLKAGAQIAKPQTYERTPSTSRLLLRPLFSTDYNDD